MPIDYNDTNNISGATKDAHEGGVSREHHVGFDLFARQQLNSSIGSSANVELYITNAADLLEAAGLTDLDLLKFDRETFSFLEYSNVVVARHVENVVYYYIIQLASTGIASQPPSAIIQFETNKRDPYKKNADNNIVLPGIAIEQNLRSTIESTIAASLSNKPTFVNVGGLSIFASVDITSTEVAAQSLSQVVNQINSIIALRTGKYSDKSLFDLLKSKDIRALNYNAVSESPVFLGDIRYTNFTTALTAKSIKGGKGINEGGGEIKLSETYGYVSLSVYEKQVSVLDARNMPINTTVFSAFPTITVNALTLAVPSTGTTLMAIAQSAIITRDKRWAAILADTVRPGKNPGVVTLLKNESVEGKAELIDLTNKAFSTEQRQQLIIDNIEDNPVLQLDIPMFSYGTNTLNIFAIGATPDHEQSVNARQEIIRVCGEITNGVFPADYDINKIFAIAAVTLPYGTFVDKDKKIKSLDEIDIMYMLDRKTNASVEMQRDFIASEVGAVSDLVKIKVLDELKRSISITGYKERIVFDPEFIVTLLSSITGAGIVFTADASRVVENVSYGFDVTQNLYGAGFANAGNTGGNTAFRSHSNNGNNGSVNGEFFTYNHMWQQ